MTTNDHDHGAGYSGPVLQRGQRVLDDYDSCAGLDLKSFSPSVHYEKAWAWGPEGAPQSSHNHEANAWNVEAARAALSGTPAEFAAAKAVLLQAYYPRELGSGDGGGFESSEMLCPDNHTHQYTSAIGMSRVAAWKSQDRALLEKSEELLTVAVTIFKALATPAPNWFIGGAPGMRSPGQPLWWAGTAWLRYVMGCSTPMPELERRPGRPDLWLDPSSLGLRALRYLRESGDPALSRAAAADQGWVQRAKMKYSLTVYRGNDRVLSVIEAPKEKVPNNACDWTEVPYLESYKATVAQTKFGLNWQTPPPAPPPGAQVIRFPSW